MMQSFKEFRELPQELVDHIISFVPEYGHRVCQELHKRSCMAEEVSVYCDLYRYCVRLHKGPFNACVTVLDTLLEDTFADIKLVALQYLAKNRRAFLREYLKHTNWIPASILTDLGFANVDHWTKISLYFDNDQVTVIYRDIEYCVKVLDLYTLMILLDNGFMSKKEFDFECASIMNIDAVLEIMLSMYAYFHHIFNAAIRHFPDRISTVIDRIEREQAIVDNIVYDEQYDNSPKHIEHIRHRLCAQKMDIDIDKNILRRIRDRLMKDLNYDDCWDNNNDIDNHSLFSLIESLADED